MARFSGCGGDDEERSNHRPFKRIRGLLRSMNEYEEDSESPNVESHGEEDEEETQSQGNRMESFLQEYTSHDIDLEVVIEERTNGTSLDNHDSSLMAESNNSSLSLTLSDPSVLDCPICCELLKIPIFQCDNGHLACSTCCTKVRNKCPSCALPIGYIRNRAMENIIEASRVSCRNAKYGCKENTSYENRFTHEKLCVFKPCSCPILGCNYTSNYKDLNNHVSDNHYQHDDVMALYSEAPFTMFLNFNGKTIMYLEEDDCRVFVVQAFRASNGALISVNCIAPLSPEVRKFSCSLVNETANGLLLKQSFMVNSIQKLNHEQPEDGFVLIPSYMIDFDGEGFEVQFYFSRDPILVET